jgi:hypothetical protein
MSKLFKQASEYKEEKVNFYFEESSLNTRKRFLIIERLSLKEKLIKFNKIKTFIQEDLSQKLLESNMPEFNESPLIKSVLIDFIKFASDLNFDEEGNVIEEE